MVSLVPVRITDCFSHPFLMGCDSRSAVFFFSSIYVFWSIDQQSRSSRFKVFCFCICVFFFLNDQSKKKNGGIRTENGERWHREGYVGRLVGLLMIRQMGHHMWRRQKTMRRCWVLCVCVCIHRDGGEGELVWNLSSSLYMFKIVCLSRGMREFQ